MPRTGRSRRPRCRHLRHRYSPRGRDLRCRPRQLPPQTGVFAVNAFFLPSEVCGPSVEPHPLLTVFAPPKRGQPPRSTPWSRLRHGRHAKGAAPQWGAAPSEWCERSLLEDDRGASLFELSLGLLGGVLVDTLEDGAGDAIDESLR